MTNKKDYLHCPFCELKSYSKEDIKRKFCGKCKKFIKNKKYVNKFS